MDRRSFLKNGAWALAIGASGLAYPTFLELKKYMLRNHVKGVLENIVSLETVTEYKSLSEEDQGKHVTKGEGIVMGDYVLTVDHIVSFDVIVQNFGSMSMIFPIEKLKETTTIGGEVEIEQIVKDVEKDIAVLKLPKDYEKPEYKVKIGDDNKLKLFDELYLIGDAYDLVNVPRPGHLGSEEVIEIPGKYFKMHNGKIFTGKTANGDSGSPVLNENGELVGIIASATGAYGIFNPINWYKKAIAKYEEAQEASLQGSS